MVQNCFNKFLQRSNLYRVSVSLDKVDGVDFVCVGWGFAVVDACNHE